MTTKTLTDFDELVDQHNREIFSYLWRMMHNVQDAEDALQETFLRAFRGFPRLKDHANLRAWLYKIATNVAYTQLNRRTRRDSRITDFSDIHATTNPLDLEQKELFQAILTAIRQLPHKQQTALILRNYQELSYQEIGETLACSPESARANVYQALQKLRAQFTESEK